MTKPNPGRSELFDVRYAASKYVSQIKDPTEIARAQKLIGSAYDQQLKLDMTDLRIRTRRSGININAAEEAQAYVAELRNSSSSIVNVGRKTNQAADKFKADAIVNYLNKVRKWNLR